MKYSNVILVSCIFLQGAELKKGNCFIFQTVDIRSDNKMVQTGKENLSNALH